MRGGGQDARATWRGLSQAHSRFFNLEALPARVNLAKSAKIGQRELALARQWNHEGLLSASGLKAVEIVVE